MIIILHPCLRLLTAMLIEISLSRALLHRCCGTLGVIRMGSGRAHRSRNRAGRGLRLGAGCARISTAHAKRRELFQQTDAAGFRRNRLRSIRACGVHLHLRGEGHVLNARHAGGANHIICWCLRRIVGGGIGLGWRLRRCNRRGIGRRVVIG